MQNQYFLTKCNNVCLQMSREGAVAGSGRHDGATTSLSTHPFPPQFYPMTGYQGASQPWYPPHPSIGVPGQWSPSWRPPIGYPTPTPPWPAHQTPSTSVSTAPSDEYTVDTLRRIYKDDDGRVEIQRVKVQRRQPDTGTVTLVDPEAMSVVPVAAINLNERRPPPRKNRRKQDIHMTPMGPTGPYPWYPYMPYMPYPYPYPYYVPGCMWPPGAPSDSVSTWSGNEESQAISTHQDSILNSQRLESRASRLSRDSLSSALHRTSSPAAASHITDTHSLAPSDSVSVRGRKRETSLERALRGPTPPPRTKSRASSSLGSKSDKTGENQDWIIEMQRALRTRGKVINQGSLRSDQTDIYKKIPPIRKRRKIKADYMSDKSSVTDLKDADDDVSERQSVVSDATFDESSRLSSELNYAFRKLERSVDAFKTGIASDPSPLQSQAASPSVDISHSSGDATPTDARVTPLPFSDICSLAEKAEEEEIRHKKHGRARTISESISTHPSLETARVGSAPDVSYHSKPIAESSSQSKLTTSTPTKLYPPPLTSTANVTTSSTETETTEVTLKTDGALEEVKPLTSPETQTLDVNVIHSPGTPLSLPCQPSTSSQSSQTHPTPPPSLSKKTESGPTKIGPEPIGLPSSKATNDSAPIGFEEVGAGSGRHSQASSATTFFSVQTVSDSHTQDTDSTDIPMHTADSTTADEVNCCYCCCCCCCYGVKNNKVL